MNKMLDRVIKLVEAARYGAANSENIARRIFDEIREPTYDMVTAGIGTAANGDGVEATWKAMIDEIIE